MVAQSPWGINRCWLPNLVSLIHEMMRQPNAVGAGNTLYWWWHGLRCDRETGGLKACLCSIPLERTGWYPYHQSSEALNALNSAVLISDLLLDQVTLKAPV